MDYETCLRRLYDLFVAPKRCSNGALSMVKVEIACRSRCSDCQSFHQLLGGLVRMMLGKHRKPRLLGPGLLQVQQPERLGPCLTRETSTEQSIVWSQILERPQSRYKERRPSHRNDPGVCSRSLHSLQSVPRYFMPKVCKMSEQLPLQTS